MQIEILSDTAKPAALRASYETAVVRAIGDRTGHWNVWLSQFELGFPLTVMINGPKGFRACHIFEAGRQSPDTVRAKVNSLLADGDPTR